VTEVADVANVAEDVKQALAGDLTESQQDIEAFEEWSKFLAIVPPNDVRDRIGKTRVMTSKGILAYVGDVVWEYLVLRHQYNQTARAPSTTSRTSRNQKQAKAAGVLWRGSVLNDSERKTMRWGMTTSSFRQQAFTEPQPILEVGYEQYAAAMGLRAVLGFIYLDIESSDVRLANVARELGLTGASGEEDEVLRQLTGGIWDVSDRPKRTYFLALAPLGHVALRLYVSRYFCQRPPTDKEFIYRVKLALRQEELDLAAVGFMRDDATSEEVRLMRGAKDANDSYAFAFECLLGYLAINAPYRLHQVLSNFGWAKSLPGT
jgi:23S rRNA maturation mini-RNase III